MPMDDSYLPNSVFYEIELLSAPTFLFSWSVSINQYANQFHHSEDYIEICVIEHGRVWMEEGQKRQLLEPHTLNVITSAADYRLIAYQNEIQCHSTVGVRVHYRISSYPKEEVSNVLMNAKENVFFLPQILSLDDKKYDDFVGKIKKITLLRNSPNKSQHIAAMAIWYELCAEIMRAGVTELDLSKRAHAEQQYATQACQYVYAHLNRPVNIQEIADHIGISVGYLQNVFKKVIGKTIVEYINELKIKESVEMMRHQKIKLKDLAYNFGIDDPSYFSRLFKKVMGVSYEEYYRTHEEPLVLSQIEPMK